MGLKVHSFRPLPFVEPPPSVQYVALINWVIYTSVSFSSISLFLSLSTGTLIKPQWLGNHHESSLDNMAAPFRLAGDCGLLQILEILEFLEIQKREQES